MRQAFIIILSLLLFWRADYKGAKRLTRLAAVWLYRKLLSKLARTLPIKDGVTIVFAPHQDDETLGCGVQVNIKIVQIFEGYPVPGEVNRHAPGVQSRCGWRTRAVL